MLPPFPYIPDDDCKRYRKRDTKDITCLIIHTTGPGLWARWKRNNPAHLPHAPEAQAAHPQGHTTQTPAPLDPAKPPSTFQEWRRRKGHEPTPLHTALRVYCGGLHRYGPHFVVCGETGEVYQLCPLDLVAQHVGGYSWADYRTGLNGLQLDSSLTDVYKAHGVISPRYLPGRTGRSTNACSVGVEVSPPKAGPNAPWSEACLASLKQLREALQTALGASQPLPWYSHSEVHPKSRIDRRGRPTDPVQPQWNPLVRSKV